MKLTFIFVFAALNSVIASNSYSQQAKISLEIENEPIRNVLKEIENVSEFYFAYNNKLIDVEKNVSVKAKDEKISTVLKKIFDGTDVESIVIDRQIVLSSKSSMGAQQIKTVSGKVSDESGATLPGVNIVLKGTTKGVITDIDGKFSISAEPTDVLVFTFIGMLSQEVLVGEQTVINIEMIADAVGLEEVVAIGYGVVKKSDITGSVGSIKVNELSEGVANSVDQLLAGKAAGVNVIQNSGEPGGGMSINVRGASSVNAGNSPLYVIDGLPIDNSRPVSTGSISAFGASRSPRNPMSSINPADIESIEVLKDASATAIYGSRGANGVILITTRSGKNEKMTVSYQTYLGFQNRARKLNLLNAQEYKQVINELIDAGGDIEESRVGEIANGGKGTDWQDELNNANAVVQDHQLSFSGGSKSTSYYLSLNFMDQEGIIKNSDFGRYGARINLKSDISDKFQVGFNATGSYTRDNFIANGFGINEWSGPLYAAYNFDPTLSVRDEDGAYALSPLLTLDNPVAVSEGMSSVSQSNRMMASMYGEYHFTNSLFARLNIGGDFVNESRKSFINSLTKEGRNNGGIAANQNVEQSNYLVEGTVNYSKTFKVHSINLMGGTTYQRFVTNGLMNEARGFPNESLGANNLGIGDQSTFGISNYLTGNRLASYIGRVNYSLYDKYLFTATARADGSSRFGESNKFGFFPSAAFAWKASNEGFIKNIESISNLKLRLSWGETGNQEIGNFPSLSTFGEGGAAIWDGSPVTGTRPLRMPNPDLRWETTEQINIGVDLSMYNGRISGSFDYFSKKTTDMLLELPIPQSTGFGSILSNVGRIDNSGVELTLSTVNLSSKNFNWRTDFTFTAMKNEVKDLGSIPEIIVGAGYTHVSQVAIIKPGLPLNSYYGWEVDGIWQEGDDFSGFTEDYKPGDLKYVDQDGDKVITDKDRIVLGNSFPDFQWSLANSFEYKGISLFLFIEGVEGVDMLNGNLIDNYFPINFRRNKFAEPYLNRWTPENPTNQYPSFTDPLKFGRRVVNSQTLLDASYIRLKTVRVSYDLPKFTRFIKSAQVYVTGENLYTLTDYIGLDPAVNPNGNPNFRIDFNAYPSARTLLFGVKVEF